MLRFAFALLIAAPALAQTPAPAAAAYQAPDYRNPASWLCRPPTKTGAKDVCSGDIDTTVVTADGAVSLDAVPAAKKPAIDCFYVYPTVSTDPGGNSDMVADPAETNVARTQFAAFRQVCRTFAPLYRQVTLAALRARLTGQSTTADRAMAYNDVAAAFAHYLKTDNKGRGFILIGHSQGSGVIKQLIQQEIEGKPVAARMISAMIPGNNVLVPQGADVGGDFKSTPICRAASQTGCVVAWVSWRAESPVPPLSLFGRTPQPGMAVACANPAALAGGRADLNSVLPNGNNIVADAPPVPKWAKGRNIYTPFVRLPGMASGECRVQDGASVLAVSVNPYDSGKRTTTLPGDVIVGGQIQQIWGLHLVDVNVALGDMVALADAQGKAWLAAQRK